MNCPGCNQKVAFLWPTANGHLCESCIAAGRLPMPWCTCGAKTPDAAGHAASCPASQTLHAHLEMSGDAGSL